MSDRIPAAAEDLVTSNVPAVVSYHDSGRRIVSFPMWVEHDDGVLRLSTPKGSRKTSHLRHDPEVGLIFTDRTNPFRYLSVSGRVVDVHDDDGLATIDRLAHRYIGSDYPDRVGLREVFVVRPTRVTFSSGTRG